ncbi:hypothetical protein TFKS16_1389 [Tannerella forsythia KS16]|jgi:ABC-type uncharacterized transport system, ATPase component|uniref:ABC-type transporter ATP-binding protein EcsA n=1 Tax=Tannerella forsythia TaxID=28112 RepID=A0A1D3UGR7_TANFO|nr:ATP-binding cassette domain-containing protein [Tannerella forsythia]BAR51647.1 hypothetical protein TFKS16_1389 [Tannerella forsythia KS16]SCQ19356.1 ABC-type transporter ATP-binding protein EcsA [Tannerella forsythia]
MIQLNNITKKFGEKIVLNNLTLSIDSPGLYGLLGINGAGKTTTIKCICGLIDASGGSISRKLSPGEIGYMPEELALYKDMDILSNMSYFCDILGLKVERIIPEIIPLIHRFNLNRDLRVQVGKLSKGNIRKVQFLCTIMHKPTLLILDEPFSGLDPISTEIMIQEITKLKNRGVAILLSTHRIEQAERICDHIFMIHRGEIVVNAPIQEALISGKSPMMVEITTLVALDGIKGAHLQSHIGEVYTYWIHPFDINHTEIIGALQKRKIIGLKRSENSLNDIFIDTVTRRK